MTDTFAALADKLKELGGSWAAYSAVGSFVLYLVGYLALRFHLTALGVGTDLAVLDERYLFTGAKFLVYFFSSVPIVILAVIPLAGFLWLISRVVPAGWRDRTAIQLTNPMSLLLAAIILSVLLIQLVMRQCFSFSNLLLADQQSAAWQWRVMLSPEESARTFFFSALVAGVIITGLLLWVARRLGDQTPRTRLLTAVLTLLVAIQFLLLPVNYGVMIIDKTLPRVADLGGIEPLKEGEEAWLVWEGKDGATWLLRGAEGRRLVTLPQKDVKKTVIVRYDPILRCIFVGTCSD